MTIDTPEFDLSATIPAGELAALRRRVTYLEAVLVQALRDGQRIKEWFSAAELAALRLPGMPSAKNAITRLAREGRWRMRKVKAQGGERNEYHFSGFPRRSFDALIDRVLAAVAPEGPGAAEPEEQPSAPMLAPPLLPAAPISTTAPPWLLPLMRVIRAKTPATVREAMQLLPGYLPKGVELPTVDEVLPELRRLGMLQ